MLSAFRAFVISADPDVLTGYNINNFDLPYLIHRAEALKLQSFLYLGRIKNVRSRVTNKSQETNYIYVCFVTVVVVSKVRDATFSSKVQQISLFVCLFVSSLFCCCRPTGRASHTRRRWTDEWPSM
jgi:DNA polymerase elongation subunit (family B)